MNRKALYLSLLFIIPLVGFLASKAILSEYDSKVQTALHEARPDLNPERLEDISAKTACINPQGNDEFCDAVENLNILQTASLIAGGVAAFLLLAIRGGGWLCRRNRKLLAMLFRPGFYATLIIVAGLIIVYAGIVVAALYYGETTYLHRVHAGIMVLVAVGAIAGVYSVLKGFALFFQEIPPSYSAGIALSRSDAPHFWQLVDEVAEKVGTTAPDNLVLGVDGGIYVTEAKLIAFNANLSGRTLYCSLAFCRLLARKELTAILGHELGHFKGEDTTYSMKFLPIYRSATSTLQALWNATTNGYARLTLQPAMAVLSFFIDSFALAEREISRMRELEADRIAVEVADAQAFACGLVKAHMYSDPIGRIFTSVPGHVRAGDFVTNLIAIEHELCGKAAEVLTPEQIAGARIPHPLDTHPALEKRLEAVGVKMESVLPQAKIIGNGISSEEGFDNLINFEEAATASFQKALHRP